MSALTGTNTDVSHLVKVLNQTLKNAGHKDIVLNYIRAQSRIQVRVAGGKTLRLKKVSTCSGGKAGAGKTLPFL